MNWFIQVFAVTLTAIRTIPQRRGAALATVAGIADLRLAWRALSCR